MDNVVQLNNGDPRISEFIKDVHELISDRFSGQDVAYATVIGALTIVQEDLIRELKG